MNTHTDPEFWAWKITILVAIAMLFRTPVWGLQRPSDPSIQSQKDEQRKTFEEYYRRGAALLRAGEVSKAVESLGFAVRLRPNDKQARRALGQALIQAGHALEAVDQFRESVRLDPQDPLAYYELGQAYLQLALNSASRLLQQNSSSKFARQLYAENFIGTNNYFEAAAQYKLALDDQPRDWNLRLRLGEVYLAEGKIDEAIQEFTRALELAPASLQAHFFSGAAQFLKGDLSAALASLNWIAKVNPAFLLSSPEFPQADRQAERLRMVCRQFEGNLEAGSTDPVMIFLRSACGGGSKPARPFIVTGGPVAQHSRAQGNTSALETFGLSSADACAAGICRACEEKLRKPPGGQLNGASAWLELGKCEYAVGQFENAFDHFSATMKADSQNPEGTYWLQEAARQLARRSFEQVRLIDPDSYLIHLLSARTLEEQQHPELAVTEYRMAIARRPQATNVRVLLAHLYWKWEKYNEAIREAQGALEIDPADVAANYLMGDSLVQMHESEKALPYLRRALSARPGFLNAEASLGRALGQLGRFQEAISELSKVAPDDADGSIHYQLYQLYMKIGQKEMARTALETSQKIRAARRQTGPPGQAGIPLQFEQK
jgi:tetratricopeptide (TPR) repeat protein